MSNHPFAFARHLIAVCAGMTLFALAQGAAHAEGFARTSSGRPAPIRGQVGVEAAQPPGQSVSSAREVPTPKDWQDLPASGVTQVPPAPAVHDVAVVRPVATDVPAAPEPAQARRQTMTRTPSHAQPKAAGQVGGAQATARTVHPKVKPMAKGPASRSLVADGHRMKKGQKRQAGQGQEAHGVTAKLRPTAAHHQAAALHARTPKRGTPAPHVPSSTQAMVPAKGVAKRTSRSAAKTTGQAKQNLASKAHSAKPAATAHLTPRVAQAKAKAGRNKPSAIEPHTATAKAQRHVVNPRAAHKVSIPPDAMPQGPRRHRPVA